MCCAGNGDFDEFFGLRRGSFRLLGVAPGVLFADVDHFHQVRIQVGFLHRSTERFFVHPGGARGNHNPVEPVFLDVVLDGVLSRVGAEVLVFPCHLHVRKGRRVFRDAFDVDYSRDVQSAVADVDADANQQLTVLVWL